jgi:uncharacterized cupredoxin-like copper-binding protein
MLKHKLGAAFAAALLGGSFATIGLAGSPVVEKIQLWDKTDGSQGMTVSAEHVKAGLVTFEVTNISTKEDHELLLVKTSFNPDQFPLDESGTRVDEDKFPGLKELGDLSEGETKTHKVKLTPGRYVMFCNEVGHFSAGMWHVLTVTP